ncbi:MAG: FtsX-like permease family protein [Cyclobacteriaceae bacterium]
MMLIFKLALKSLLGAGMRTWLNVVILSLAYVIIIIFNGVEDGARQKARTESINWEYGQGQLWYKTYDPYDPFTLQDAHGKLPSNVDTTHLVPILVRQGSIYPQGRMQTINLKGIPVNQTALALPTTFLDTTSTALPAIIGKRMAASTNLMQGDQVLIRWRDKNGTYDAREIVITKIFDSNVAGIDHGQVWLPIQKLQEMTGLKGQATLLIAEKGFEPVALDQWHFKEQDALLADIDALLAADRMSGNIIFMLLLGMALLAIFDTQVLSIFRRQKEIGTFIALGMTRPQVVTLFTVEGGANSLLATVVGSLYGIPLLIYMAHAGLPIPSGIEGISISERIFPVYSIGLILGTIALVVISATIVSFLPSRKIAKMNPTLALKGKLQ